MSVYTQFIRMNAWFVYSRVYRCIIPIKCFKCMKSRYMPEFADIPIESLCDLNPLISLYIRERKHKPPSSPISYMQLMHALTVRAFELNLSNSASIMHGDQTFFRFSDKIGHFP